MTKKSTVTTEEARQGHRVFGMPLVLVASTLIAVGALIIAAAAVL